MLYSPPKKIQMQPSLAKWRIESELSVLVFVELKNTYAKYPIQQGEAEPVVFDHFTQLLKKAKALNIITIDLNQDNITDGMMCLGEYLSQGRQLMIAGEMSASFRQVIQHMASVSTNICLIDDALIFDHAEQHIQCIDNFSAMGLHHVNTQTLLRLWSLSAPTEYILSAQGILLAVAEQLNIEALEIDPSIPLRQYGLDSVAMVSLVGLWRANGANIRYEDFMGGLTLAQLLKLLLNHAG